MDKIIEAFRFIAVVMGFIIGAVASVMTSKFKALKAMAKALEAMAKSLEAMAVEMGWQRGWERTLRVPGCRWS